jgi:type IV pilus assembly protein PilV
MKGHPMILRGTEQGSRTMRQDGFTILELLVASIIMLVALLGIAAVLPTADLTIHQSGQTTKAISLAQEMIEIIKNDRYNDLNLYNGVNTSNTATFPANNPDPPVPGSSTNFLGWTSLNKWKDDINLILLSGAGITNGFGTITVDTVASDLSAPPNPILRKVTVTINWTERGENKLVTLATLASGI